MCVVVPIESDESRPDLLTRPSQIAESIGLNCVLCTHLLSWLIIVVRFPVWLVYS